MSQNDFLRGVSLFSGLTDDELKNLGGKAEAVQFVRDAFICKEGQAADSMFVIKSGIVQIFCDDGKGGRKILTHLKLGEYFGEMALLTEEPRTASAVALAETEVIRIKKDDFHSLLRTSPGVALSIIKTLCERLAKANIGTASEKKTYVYAVMGPDTGSGKSLFARNLAYAMQQVLGRDILLYDPNLRDDKVARFLGVAKHSRIIDELVDRERVSDLKKYVEKAPCGLHTIVPQENGLTDLRLKEFHTFSIMKTVMETYEFIVVDSSSMFTKVTKEIVQGVDKIVYLISSRNVSVNGLIKHFEDTRRTWKVDPTKVLYGVNRMTDDPAKESKILEEDKAFLRFELPYDKALADNRTPDTQVLVQREPNHPIAKAITEIAHAMLFDQVLGLSLPTFDTDPGKKELARRWAETGLQELGALLRRTELKTPVTRNGQTVHLLEGRTAKWLLNQHVVALVNFANRFKQEFGLDKVIFTMNGQESVV
ncbi:MAG: cyclic nucleotide-binding domain-containing protein [Candidatus Riflebacteria bacterium]|nr:cyclic nucleotide-binding domain-containing protein [Candidatus Riflebacteria bacterium]